MNRTGTENRDFRVVVVGAGMSGVLMGIRLKQAGMTNFTIYEKGDAVGGTWRENTYPGLHCDVPSHLYCYSFDLQPGWTKLFSSGPEIREYFEGAAKRFGVIDAIRFGVAVTEGRWIDGKWRIALSNGEEDHADVLISATGILHQPAYPDLAGIETFEGAKFHSARWNHDISLEDKRIGIVGTGSTSVQIVSALAGKVRHLELFQRTAQWVLPVSNPAFTETQKARYGTYPFLLKWRYEAVRLQYGLLTDGGVMGKIPAVRKGLEVGVETYLATVRDPDLRRKLTPNYQVGCKRLVMSPDFYEAIQRKDTALVTERIDRVECNGVRTSDGLLHELDLLVLATGFDPGAFMRPMRLFGRDGIGLDEIWAERPTAYHSMAVPDMPNFFMLEGPFSPIGNLSVVLISEWQADYVMKCLELVRSRQIALAPTRAATAGLMARYRDAARTTIWATGGCQSWYQDEEGVPIIYPFTADEFRQETCEDPDLGDFEVEDLSEMVS